MANEKWYDGKQQAYLQNWENEHPLNKAMSFLNSSFNDIPKMPTFEQDFRRNVLKAEEKILVDALSLFLERTPTTEDYKDCEMIYRQGVDNEFTFCHKHIPIGVVKRSFPSLEIGDNLNANSTITVTFTPFKY